MPHLIALTATRGNMKKVSNPSVFAYDVMTGARYSANPADYWNMPDDSPLRDETGRALILVREHCELIPVGV